MPNYAYSRVTLRGTPDVLRAIIAERFTKDCLDFDKVLPQPEGFDATLVAGSDEVLHDMFAKPEATFAQYRSYPWVPELIDTVEKFQRFMAERHFEGKEGDPLVNARHVYEKYQHNIDVSGCRTWYDWNNRNWGTKWPATANGAPDLHAIEEGKVSFEIDTAWCEPLPVFDALVAQYPGVVLDYTTEYEGDDEVSGDTIGPFEPSLALPSLDTARAAAA